LAFISEFNVQMLYLPGLHNVVTNFLSRLSLAPRLTGDVTTAAAAPPINFEEMATEQNRCKETQRCSAEHVSTGVFQPVVPKKFQQDIILNLHNISHPGLLASHCLVSSRYVWCGLAQDVEAAEQDPVPLQKKVSPHPHPPAPLLPHPHRFGGTITIIVIVSSQLLIIHPNGWKPFL
jgi:hypothetical protein